MVSAVGERIPLELRSEDSSLSVRGRAKALAAPARAKTPDSSDDIRMSEQMRCEGDEGTLPSKIALLLYVLRLHPKRM